MDLSNPLRSILPNIEAEILQHLSTVSAPMTGRQVARVLNQSSHKTTLKALNKLSNEGLLATQHVGNAYLYSINRQHIFWPHLESMLTLSAHQELRTVVHEVINRLGIKPSLVLLYGSTARGFSTAVSDIDLFAVFPDERGDDLRDELNYELTSTLEARFGNTVSIYSQTATELRNQITAGDPLIDSLNAEAQVLYGTPPTELRLRHHEQETQDPGN